MRAGYAVTRASGQCQGWVICPWAARIMRSRTLPDGQVVWQGPYCVNHAWPSQAVETPVFGRN